MVFILFLKGIIFRCTYLLGLLLEVYLEVLLKVEVTELIGTIGLQKLLQLRPAACRRADVEAAL